MLTTIAMWSLVSFAAEPVPPGQAPPPGARRDVNQASALYGKKVSPTADRGRVSVWYFASEDAALTAQIDALAAMQAEMRDDRLDLAVRVVVPQAMTDAAPKLTAHDLPVLVDDAGTVQASWGAQPGHMFILDLDGRVRDLMDLRVDDLRDRFVAYDLESRIETLVFDLGSAKERAARDPQ